LRRVLSASTAAWAFRSKRSTAARLRAFALAEECSMVDMQIAASRTGDPARAARYLEHAADEARHARVFRRRAQELHPQARLEARAQAEGLYERLGEGRFLATVHRGESLARVQFEAYVRYLQRTGRERERALFEGVLVDERRHEAYTLALLEELGERAGAGHAQAWLHQAAWFDRRERYRRAAGGWTRALYGLVMALLYLSLLPLSFIARRRQPKAGWVASER
jgi:rubrerythrin